VAGGVCGRGRHRHPDPIGSGRDARPRRPRISRRWCRRGPTPARLARATVPVRGRRDGRWGPQEQRVRRADPAGRRLRTPADHRRHARDHRDHDPAAHRRPGRRPGRGRSQQGPTRSVRGAAGGGDRSSSRGGQPGRATGAAVAGRRRHSRGPGRVAGHLRPHRPVVARRGCVRSDGRPLQPGRRPQPRRLPQGPRRRSAQSRSPRPTTRIRRTAVPDDRPHRPARGVTRPRRPARVPGSWAAGPVPVQPPTQLGRAPAARRPTRARRPWPTATPWSSTPWPPA
jgi:hypothetical protein